MTNRRWSPVARGRRVALLAWLRARPDARPTVIDIAHGCAAYEMQLDAYSVVRNDLRMLARLGLVVCSGQPPRRWEVKS